MITAGVVLTAALAILAVVWPTLSQVARWPVLLVGWLMLGAAYASTQIKALLKTAQVVTFSWKAAGGVVYTDFHGHEPGTRDDFWEGSP